jgi:hypothetical protein
MTAEAERIFDEVDHWASQRSHRAEPARDHKAVTYRSSRALKESKSEDATERHSFRLDPPH